MKVVQQRASPLVESQLGTGTQTEFNQTVVGFDLFLLFEVDFHRWYATYRRNNSRRNFNRTGLIHFEVLHRFELLPELKIALVFLPLLIFYHWLSTNSDELKAFSWSKNLWWRGGGGKGYPVIQNWQWCHNFPRKLSIDFSQIRGSRTRERRERNELVFFRKLTLFKSKINHWFLLLSSLEPLMQRNLDANFLGNCDVRSSFGSPGKDTKSGEYNYYSDSKDTKSGEYNYYSDKVRKHCLGELQLLIPTDTWNFDTLFEVGRWSWCYTIEHSLQPVLQRWKNILMQVQQTC